MKKELVRAQDIFLDKVNQICGKFGLNNIMAQLYVTLYFNNGMMSLDDMVKRLKISKGSASINIRALERYGAVRKVWVKGSRKDFYEAEGDIYKVIMDRVRAMAKSRLSDIEHMLDSSYKALDSMDNLSSEDGNARIFKEKMDDLRALYEKAQGLFDFFNTGLMATMASAKPENVKEEPALVVNGDGLTRQG